MCILKFQGHEELVAGALTTNFQTTVNEEFNEYIQSLRPENRTGYHWFSDYWQDLFHCDLPGKRIHKIL